MNNITFKSKITLIREFNEKYRLCFDTEKYDDMCFRSGFIIDFTDILVNSNVNLYLVEYRVDENDNIIEEVERRLVFETYPNNYDELSLEFEQLTERYTDLTLPVSMLFDFIRIVGMCEVQ